MLSLLSIQIEYNTYNEYFLNIFAFVYNEYPLIRLHLRQQELRTN